MVASWWQHTALFLFLFDVKGRWAVFNNLETFLITDRAYQIDFYKNVGPRFNPGALNQHPRLLHGPPLATNSTSYALLPPTWPLMHFSHQLPNAFQRMRMMHRIIYVATNFLSKTDFFRDHGESRGAYRPWMWILGPVTLFEGYQVTPTWSRISKNPKNRMHFDESEWCIIESFTLPPTSLVKQTFFAITGNRAYRPWMWILRPVTLYEGYQVTPTRSRI